MENIGRIINDSYCNGFAGRVYDMDGAIIIAEGDAWIVCKKTNGLHVMLDFQTFDWNRDEKGNLTNGIKNLSVRTDMQEYIDNWCK
jgi:hypothetical protein